MCLKGRDALFIDKKASGAGLASICILATMVMVTVSTTTCLYIGSDDMINSIYPRDICIDSRTANADNGLSISKVTETVYDKLYKYGTLPHQGAITLLSQRNKSCFGRRKK